MSETTGIFFGIIGGLIAVIFLWGFVAYGRSKKPSDQKDAEPVDLTVGDLSSQAKADLKKAIADRRQIEAIKIVRDDTDAHLADAKYLVDRLASGQIDWDDGQTE